MATELIATGSAAATSADFDVTDPVTVFLKDMGEVLRGDRRGMQAFIEIKDSDGGYHPVGTLGQNVSAAVIAGPGTYRVRRAEGDVQFGVESS